MQKNINIMTALELNAQIHRYMADISLNEVLLQKVADYMKKLLAKKPDPTLMTKEQFYAIIEKGEAEHESGKCTVLHQGDSVTEMLRRSGYDI